MPQQDCRAVTFFDQVAFAGMAKRLYIETVGCQMNMLDSELVVASLRKQGYEVVARPADADTILFNTCSVRQHAEDKIYSALGRLKHAKKHHPHKIVGVLGCMAQKDQQLIFERAPYVDLIVGPGQLHQIPDLLERVAAGSRSADRSQPRASGRHATGNCRQLRELRSAARSRDAAHALSGIRADHDRLRQVLHLLHRADGAAGPSRVARRDQIVAEARQLAGEGCREITLLGQTVNSYQYRDAGRTTRLSDLLARLHEIDGLDRLKFITNYPKHMTDDLLQAVRDLPKCSPYLHVPAQSGSNRMLERMKRGYSVEDYREMLARVYATIPAAAVTSDFIVGFCGETEDDFQATVELVRESRFKNSFIFKYSERPGTKSSQLFPDDVPEEIKRRRNNELLAIQNAISEADQPAVHRPPRRDSRRGAQQSQPEAPRGRADRPACRPDAL